MASLFERDAQAALVFRACASFAPWLDFAPIRDVALHKAAGILVVDLANVIMTKLANLAASSALSAPAPFAARPSFRSFLHELSPCPR
jgi:hypothetical protein